MKYWYAILALPLALAACDEKKHPPQKMCYKIVPFQKSNSSPILINRCSGKTWILAPVTLPDQGAGTQGTYTYRWHEISSQETEALFSVQDNEE